MQQDAGGALQRHRPVHDKGKGVHRPRALVTDRACNAFDTASLLIALLRVSNIPARYQMGTIEVPIEKAMNWLGGFSDPRAAGSRLRAVRAR